MQDSSSFATGAGGPPATFSRPGSSVSRWRVLVVDDVAMNRDIVAAMLRAEGHEAVCAQDGAEAVSCVTDGAFDLVLMDVRMPGMDGLEATRRIRGGHGAACRVPIVALTAQSDPDHMAECCRAGMNAHLFKPFDATTLLEAVEHALQLRPVPPVAAPPRPEPICVFDRPTFDRLSGLLEGHEAAACLRLLHARGETLLGELGRAELGGDMQQLGESVHSLAGSAGMFGFLQVAASARAMQRAVAALAPDRADAGRALGRAVGAMQTEICRHLVGEPVGEMR